ncbi:RNA-directed DNA polymerase, eukaryota [Tanacetum coccineum]
MRYLLEKKSIQEARNRKRKDKEKLKDKIIIGFKNDRMRLSVVAFSKRKAKSRKNKQGCVGMDEGASLNDVDDEFSEEENSFSESENISNIGKSLGIYIGENKKDFSNNKSFKEFLDDIKHHGSDGSFSVASTRTHIDHSMLQSLTSSTTWIACLPRKVNIFLWRFNLDRLPHRLNLSKHGIEIGSILCPICSNNMEFAEHIFFSYEMVDQILAHDSRLV